MYIYLSATRSTESAVLDCFGKPQDSVGLHRDVKRHTWHVPAADCHDLYLHAHADIHHLDLWVLPPIGADVLQHIACLHPFLCLLIYQCIRNRRCRHNTNARRESRMVTPHRWHVLLVILYAVYTIDLVYDARHRGPYVMRGHKASKAKQRCVMGVGMCLYAQLVQCANEK